jgi:hypothetical protein
VGLPLLAYAIGNFPKTGALAKKYSLQRLRSCLRAGFID